MWQGFFVFNQLYTSSGNNILCQNNGSHPELVEGYGQATQMVRQAHHDNTLLFEI
jgi:hypothetical protein